MLNVRENEDGMFLSLNLQYFADEGGDGDSGDNHEPDAPSQSDDGGQGGEPQGDDNPDKPADSNDSKPGKTKVEFTDEQQEEVNRIIAERLKREKEKQEREAEKQKKEEQGEYKQLYDDLKAEYERHIREVTVNTHMLEAGYSKAQIDRYAKFIEGTEEADIKAAIETLKEDVPPSAKHTDPSPGPSDRKAPKQKDGKESSKERYQALKAKGKIK